jgi:hypothetical protein
MMEIMMRRKRRRRRRSNHFEKMDVLCLEYTF